jgi:hypothetical protein
MTMIVWPPKMKTARHFRVTYLKLRPLAVAAALTGLPQTVK